MEESEKRRERLTAMRMEAARAGANVDSERVGSASGVLSNPFIESASPAPVQYTSSRFDYYTDPMSAFSGSKRNNITTQGPQGHYNTSPRPVYQGMASRPVYHSPGANSRGQSIQQVPGAHFNQSPFGSPMEVVTPSAIFQGNPPNALGGAFSYSNLPHNLPRDGNFSNTGFGQEDPPYVNYSRARGQKFNCSYSGHGDSRYPDSGRGRCQSLGNWRNPSSGQGGRRGAGSRESVSAGHRPHLYYRKEMVEDPWKQLTPVIWKDIRARDSEKSWLPASISMKKAKVSAESSQVSISKQSLAEYLASFNDSTDG